MPYSTLLVLDKQLHLCCLLNYEMKVKRGNQSKAPSINKHCFLFPLSFFVTAELYLLGCQFLIANPNGLRSSIAFACCDCSAKLWLRYPFTTVVSGILLYWPSWDLHFLPFLLNVRLTSLSIKPLGAVFYVVVATKFVEGCLTSVI